MDDRAEEVVSECVEGDIPTENGGVSCLFKWMALVSYSFIRMYVHMCL